MEGNAGARRTRRWGAHAFLGTSLALVVSIALYPRLGAFLPACPFHEYFGVLCPGCGGTRALVALLHWRVSEALRLNALFVVLLPFGMWFAAESYRRAIQRRAFEWPHVPLLAASGMALAGVVFVVLRNVTA